MSSKTQAPVNATIKPSLNTDKSGLLQRKCACGNSAGLTGKCATCQTENLTLQRKQTAAQDKVSEVPPIAHEALSLPRVPFIQAKLTIGASDDPLEREADQVADQVMAAPAHPAVSDAPPRIQRFMGQPTGQVDMPVPASVDRVLSSPGRPLEPALQQDMGQRFGHDFSQVRIHTDAAAERSAREVNANAYTMNHDIVFGAGQFSPNTHKGQRLIAHELTHIVQQSMKGSVLTASTSSLIQRQIPGPEELAGAAKQWLGRKYSEGKEAVYKGLINGLRKFQKMTFDMLREQSTKLPASVQPASITILNIWEEVFGVLITLLLAVVGIVVGFSEGVVDIVEGLVRLIYGILKWFMYLILGFFDNGQKFEQYNKEIIAAASKIPDGLRAIVRDWLIRFEKAPIDRGSLMIGELTGQIIAFIASFGVAAAKVGQVPKLVGEFTVVASRGGELALATSSVSLPTQAAAAGGAVALTSPTLMQAADKGTNVPPESPPVKVEDTTRGFAIERDHLDSMPEYSRPKDHNFPGIDAWKGGREMTRDTKAGRMRIIYDAEVLQIKSVGSANPSTIRASVQKALAGIEASAFEEGGLRVVNPRARRIDILFEEGSLLDVTSETKTLLTEFSATAGNRGVEIRWFRYSSGRKISIPIP